MGWEGGTGSVGAAQFSLWHRWSPNITSCLQPSAPAHKWWTNSSRAFQTIGIIKCLHSRFLLFLIPKCQTVLLNEPKVINMNNSSHAATSVWCLSSVEGLHFIILAERDDGNKVWYWSSESSRRSRIRAEQTSVSTQGCSSWLDST